MGRKDRCEQDNGRVLFLNLILIPFPTAPSAENEKEQD
jgi:hypothetical protein